MSVLLGEETFTTEQLQALWDESIQAVAPVFEETNPQYLNRNVFLEDYRTNIDGSRPSNEERSCSIGAMINHLTAFASDASRHYALIDEEISKTLLTCFKAPENTPKIDAANDNPVNKARKLLQRLPPLPPQIDLSYGVWNGLGLLNLQRYFNASVSVSTLPNERRKTSPWEELQVVTRFSTVIQRVALIVASSHEARFDIGVCLHNFLNFVSELVDEVEAQGKDTGVQAGELERGIVRAYLWAMWTRCLQLFFWFVLRYHLLFDHDEKWNRLLALRGMTLLMHPSIRATLYGWENERVPYMCSWAFEVLKTDRASLGLDFRQFHQRYSRLHGGKKARCLWESDSACDGGHPLGCGRFQDKRLVADEQSIHDRHAGECKRIKWDMASYVSVTGPVAVSFQTSRRGRVKYIEASERTMAISHVWSHGHGGRPHTGINECLHKRFSQIAQRHGCDSFWVDTLCIPDEHELRKEAISYINRIFAQSKIVLVLDRDLMEIDMSDETTALVESLLATFLVCDWNVRAWTMLEAMKGCHNLYLLCKDNCTISLRKCLIDIHQKGRIDLVALFLATQHLLPSSTDPFRRASSRKTLEGAASLLSHRHATREGDDIVIWSLISNTRVHFNARDLWQDMVGRSVRTAFLMSNARRLENVSGFSWAPETPYVRRTGQGSTVDLLGPYLVYDGEGSEEARITAKGLRGSWLVYHLDHEDAERYQDAPVTTVSFTPEGRRENKILGGHKILNRCWQSAFRHLETHQFVVLIQALGLGGDLVYRAKSDRGESHGNVFAVCVSDDGSK